jgi:hypothetical protein
MPSLACAALVLTSAPEPARADTVDDGMCVVVQALAFEVGADHSVDPAELETADPAARSEDRPPSAGHLLCARPDDPRCSPLSADDSPSSPDLPARASALLVEALRLPSRPLREVAFGPAALLGASLGTAVRTYRPPRA